MSGRSTVGAMPRRCLHSLQ